MKRFLIFLLLTSPAMAQTHTFPALDTNNVFTGTFQSTGSLAPGSAAGLALGGINLGQSTSCVGTNFLMALDADKDGNNNFGWQICHELNTRSGGDLVLRTGNATGHGAGTEDLWLVSDAALFLNVPLWKVRQDATSGSLGSFVDKNNNFLMRFTNDTTSAHPNEGIIVNVPLIGGNTGTNNFVIRGNGTTSIFAYNSSANIGLFNIQEAAAQNNVISFNGWATDTTTAGQQCYSGQIGGVCLKNTEGINWRNNAGSGDVSLRKNTSDQLTWPNVFSIGSAGSTGLIISGNTSGTTTLIPTAIASGTATFPANTGTVAELNLAQSWSAAQSFGSGDILPTAAGGTDLGSASLPFGNLWLGTAATNNFKFQPAVLGGARTIAIPDPNGTSNLTLTPGVTSQKAETGSADGNVLTITPASAPGTYRACFNASVASATGGTIAWTLSYKNSNGVAQTNDAMPLFQQGTAAPNTTFSTSAAGEYQGCWQFDVDNSSTVVVVKWVGGGTTAAKVSATIERLN